MAGEKNPLPQLRRPRDRATFSIPFVMESGMSKTLLPFDHDKKTMHVWDVVWNKIRSNIMKATNLVNSVEMYGLGLNLNPLWDSLVYFAGMAYIFLEESQISWCWRRSGWRAVAVLGPPERPITDFPWCSRWYILFCTFTWNLVCLHSTGTPQYWYIDFSVIGNAFETFLFYIILWHCRQMQWKS